MSRLALSLSESVSSIELDGNIIYTGTDMDEVGAQFEMMSLNLELLRETVCKKMFAIQYQSDQSRDIRETRCEALRRALENAGVPQCDDVLRLNFEGFILHVGVTMEPDEWHTNSPGTFEIVSATHRGADAMEFINTIGGDDAWERLTELAWLQYGSKK